MRKQEAGIEKAKEGCTAFHIACFSVAKHAVNQQSKHKQRGKHAEQCLCIHKLIHENHIKQAEQICNDMCALYLTCNRTIEFIHPNQTKKPNAAMQYFKKYPKKFLPVLVTALAECIHIVPKAASVDLSTGDKGIVLIENTRDFMRPVVLRLSDNQIYDLSDKNVYQEMQVTDIMKTMDNRVAMDEETLKQFVPDEKLRQLTQEFRRKLAAGKK